MKYEDRKRLMAKSLLCFGRTGRYKAIMKRGRVVTDNAGNFSHTAPISAQEMEDTMDYILEERKKKQQAIMEEMNVGSRSKEDVESGDQRVQPVSSEETTGESTEVSTDGSDKI